MRIAACRCSRLFYRSDLNTSVFHKIPGWNPQNVRNLHKYKHLAACLTFPKGCHYEPFQYGIFGEASLELPGLFLLWACPRDFSQSSEFLGVERAMRTAGANHRARRLGSGVPLLPTRLSHSANKQSGVWSVNASQAPISPVLWSALCPVILAKYLGSFFFFFLIIAV